jgi:hypothetical protein
MDWQTFISLAGIPAIGGAYWLAWGGHSKASDLREKLADAEARLSNFQIEVAKKYASVDYLKDVEGRLMEYLRKVDASVEKLDTKIERLLHRGGD